MIPKTVDGIEIQPSQTKPVNLLSLVEELKKSVVMIKDWKAGAQEVPEIGNRSDGWRGK
jgi:hypothetical protein